jgi:hypothetical protein
MDGKEEIQTRRESLEISAVEPNSGRPFTVLISYHRLHGIKKSGSRAIKEAKYTVTHILQNPTAIFEGLCYDEDEDSRGYGWRCYCGIPQCDYTLDGQELPPRNKRVFLVFVNTDKMAYNWRWEKCDEHDNRLPIDYENRFKKRCL